MYEILINDLISIFNDGAYLNVVINNRINDNKIQNENKKTYTKILYGVCEQKLFLDYLLKEYTKGKRIKPYLRNALRIGVYIFRNLNMAPFYVVNELVAAVKKIDFNASKMCNGILRNYLKNPSCDLNFKDEIEKISITESIPYDLVKLLYQDYKSDVQSFFKESCIINSYRINTLKIESCSVVKELDKEGIEYEIDGTHLKTKLPLLDNELFKNGMIIAQDISSMRVAEFSNVLPGSYVLDCCSAPGGKTMHMAALMKNKGTIIATDLYEERVKKIEENAKKLGVTIVETFACDSTSFDYSTKGLFDTVLVDAPCSGLGTINHKPDLKYRITLDDISDIINIQKAILNNVAKCVKENGTLVYSTCTINKQENERQVRNFLKRHPEFVIIEEKCILPSSNEDGFYMCKLEKKGK